MAEMKKRSRAASRRRVTQRRWHIPPPLIHGSETLEGGGILNEWGSELGVVLWQAFRDASLRAGRYSDSRADLFAGAGILDQGKVLEVLGEHEDDGRLSG